MKICKDCKIAKPLEEFYTLRSKYLYAVCKPCHNARSSKQYKDRKKTPPKIGICQGCGESKALAKGRAICRECVNQGNAEWRNKTKQRLREIVDRVKSAPCTDCHNVFPPYVMDLDHREDCIKVEDVSEMVLGCVSEERLLAEIEKCDVVCANCHRIRTFQRNPRIYE